MSQQSHSFVYRHNCKLPTEVDMVLTRQSTNGDIMNVRHVISFL